MNKKNIFKVLGIIVVIVGLLILVLNLQTSEKRLDKILEKLPNTKTIVVGDTYPEETVIYTVSEEEKVSEIMDYLIKIQLDGNSSTVTTNETETRYFIELYDDEDKLIETFNYAPLSFKDHNLNITLDSNEEKFATLFNENFSASFSKLFKDTMIKLNEVTALEIRDVNTEELLRTIKDKKKISNLIDIIGDLKISDTNNLISSDDAVYIDLVDKDSNLIAYLIFADNLYFELDTTGHYLEVTDIDTIKNIIK